MTLGPPVPVRADVRRPNVAAVTELFGLFRFTQLPILNASSRNWNVALRGPRGCATSFVLSGLAGFRGQEGRGAWNPKSSRQVREVVDFTTGDYVQTEIAVKQSRRTAFQNLDP